MVLQATGGLLGWYLGSRGSCLKDVWAKSRLNLKFPRCPFPYLLRSFFSFHSTVISVFDVKETCKKGERTRKVDRRV